MTESVMTIDQFGSKVWRNSAGEYHRTGGPAIEYSDNVKSWFVNGKCHRINGPAIEHPNGAQSWYANGKCLGNNDKGFWALWDTLTPEQKQDPTLLSYLPEKF